MTTEGCNPETWQATGNRIPWGIQLGWEDLSVADIPHDPDLYQELSCGNLTTGQGSGGGFGFDVDLSMPCLVTAIHAGHRVRDELLPLMAMTEAERLFEEDPATDVMIQSTPSTIWGLDSRAEYDLNRPPKDALPLTPEQFWGKRVYGTRPTNAMNRHSMDKYEQFYLFVGTCLKILVERFGFCVIYDLHSYNISRQVEKGFEAPPLFNVGTKALNRSKWHNQINDWLNALAEIKLPGIENRAVENEIFFGLGEFCHRASSRNSNILVLPTEVSKVYMDEHSGLIKDDIVHRLRIGFGRTVRNHLATAQRII